MCVTDCVGHTKSFNIAITCNLILAAWYANMQVCKYTSIQVYKYAGMQVCKYKLTQVCKYMSFQEYKNDVFGLVQGYIKGIYICCLWVIQEVEFWNRTLKFKSSTL